MLNEVLKKQSEIGADLVKQAVSKHSATNKTANSVEGKSDDSSLQILARPFIEALETGRGPRKSSEDGGFKDSMLEYMKAKGIGADLSEKKREQLARFLVLRINKQGDKLYRSGGGRDVYTKVLEKFIASLTGVVANDRIIEHQNKVFESLKGID